MRRLLHISLPLLTVILLFSIGGFGNRPTPVAPAASAATQASGQQQDSVRSWPHDTTSYFRKAIPEDQAANLQRGTAGLSTSIFVRDVVISNTNANLTNTDIFNDGETTIAINPANTNEIVITAFSGSWGANAPIWHSTDGGSTWTKRFTVPVPPMAGGTAGCPCDQVVDYGRGSRLSGSFLSFSPTDVYSGTTTNPTSSASWNWLLSMGVAQRTNSVGVGNADQPWLLVNRDTTTASQDNVYVAYDNFDGSPDMRVAVALGTNPPNFVTDNLSGFSTGFVNPGHRLAVDPNNGFVYSLFQRRLAVGADGVSKNINFMLNRSTDNGATWGLNASPTGIVVANADSTQPQPKFGTVNALLGGADHAAVDPTNSSVYYVYGNRDNGTGNNRLSIVRLTDNGMGGLTIGTPHFVTGQIQAALPSVAVAGDGTVGVLYTSFDGMTMGFPQFTTHFAISTDQGATFSDNTLLTFLSSATDNGNPRQRVLGDYNQVKAVGMTFFGAFTGNGVPLGRPFANHDPIFFKVLLCNGITCTANITQSNDPNQCGAVVSYPAPTTSGDCGTVTCTPPSGSFFPKGTTTVTCTGETSASCSFTVTVNDTQPPTITCASSVTAVSPQNVCSFGACAVVSYPAPTATDNCPGVTVSCVPPSGSCFPTGSTTVTCTATDTSANTASCSFTVTVFDVCLQDDSNLATVLLFNSQTGAYRFCCGGTTFTGIGLVTIQGCVITLQHNPADRRVLGKVDKSQFKGTASLQNPTGVTKCTITDRDTRNNSCVCP